MYALSQETQTQMVLYFLHFALRQKCDEMRCFGLSPLRQKSTLTRGFFCPVYYITTPPSSYIRLIPGAPQRAVIEGVHRREDEAAGCLMVCFKLRTRIAGYKSIRVYSVYYITILLQPL